MPKDLPSRTNLLPILRIQFVLIKCKSSAASGFDVLEPLYGMQGVRSSSLLGSTGFLPSGFPPIGKKLEQGCSGLSVLL